MNIQNPKHKEKIKALLEQGKTSEFWKLLVQELENIISRVESKVSPDLSAEQYKFVNESAKLEVKNLEKLKELPDTIISYLESPDIKHIKLDPYEDYLPESE